MKRPAKYKKPRVRSAELLECQTKVGKYWWPMPYDKKDRRIPSSVDCLYSQQYFERGEALYMLRSL